MIRMHDLPDSAALHAIEQGDFSDDIIGSGERVAVIMTQHWCPDWLVMRRWLVKAERKREPESPDIDVYVLIYNKVDYFDKFRRHKEASFGNDSIPYARYYRSGSYIGDSNHLSRDSFVKQFDR